jgi:DNA-binding CsgD family transcriptional regulator
MEQEVLGSELTDYERRIAKLAVSGLSDAEIAACVGDSISSIKGHIRRIKVKLGVSRRSEFDARLRQPKLFE